MCFSSPAGHSVDSPLFSHWQPGGQRPARTWITKENTNIKIKIHLNPNAHGSCRKRNPRFLLHTIFREFIFTSMFDEYDGYCRIMKVNFKACMMLFSAHIFYHNIVIVLLRATTILINIIYKLAQLGL